MRINFWRSSFFGLFFWLNAILVQAVEISGQVFSSAANLPLAEVAVLVDGLDFAQTDNAGQFHLSEIFPGQVIRFQKEDYIDTSLIAEDQNVHLEITLAPIWEILDITKIYLDLKDTDWFTPAVSLLYEQQVLQEVQPSYFLPQDLVSRGVLMDWIVRLGGFLPPAIQESSFCDVAINQQFAPALEFAFQQQWVQGYATADCSKGRNFQPTEPVTRAATLKIIFETLNDLLESQLLAQTCPTLDFFDVPLKVWFREYVEAAFCLDLVQGYADEGFHPESFINQAELAVILGRFLAR